MKTDRAAFCAYLAWALLVSCVFAHFLPPLRYHFAGGDPSNYEGKSLALISSFPSVSAFYPPEVSAGDQALLDGAFTDLRGLPRERLIGLMTPYVPVTRDHRIEFPHYHLYPEGILPGPRSAARCFSRSRR